MTNTSKIGYIGFILVAALLIIAIPSFIGDSKEPLVYANTERQAAQRTITTTGTADVKVVPDEIVFTLGIETQNPDITKAKTENDQRVKKLMEVLKEFKIDSKYIQTDYIGIQPQYTNYVKNEMAGYLVHKNVVVTLKDISKFENLLSGILKVGANYVKGIKFNTSQMRKYKDEARALAVKAAKEKAAAMASELGHEIDIALTIQEVQEDSWSWYDSYYSSWWGSGAGTSFSNVAVNSGEGVHMPEGSIAPGQITVSAKASVSFELKN